jgi:hypothetical protein
MIEKAFARAHLMRNPFGEPTPQERSALALLRVAPPPPGSKLQLVGDKGVGKTSALRALERTIPSACYVWVDEHGALTAPVANDNTPLLLDEAQRLKDRRALRAWLASPRTVIAATHEDLSRFAPCALPTVVLDDAPRALLDQVVRARLAWARRDDEPIAPPPALLDALHATHRGNLRDIEHALYAWYQEHWS